MSEKKMEQKTRDVCFDSSFGKVRKVLQSLLGQTLNFCLLSVSLARIVFVFLRF